MTMDDNDGLEAGQYIPDPQLPEGSIPLCTLVIVTYLDSEGDNCFTIATHGEAPMTTYLGLTVLAQQQILSHQPSGD